MSLTTYNGYIAATMLDWPLLAEMPPEAPVPNQDPGLYSSWAIVGVTSQPYTRTETKEILSRSEGPKVVAHEEVMVRFFWFWRLEKDEK